MKQLKKVFCSVILLTFFTTLNTSAQVLVNNVCVINEVTRTQTQHIVIEQEINWIEIPYNSHYTVWEHIIRNTLPHTDTQNASSLNITKECGTLLKVDSYIAELNMFLKSQKNLRYPKFMKITTVAV